ncbi:uncharacterized protein LOC144123604 [Amblyomma americanum]
MVPRRWMTTLAALTALMTSSNEELPNEATTLPLRAARPAKHLVAQSALPPVALERREEPGGKIRRPDLMTAVQVLVTVATISALVLGLSCYACHNSKGGSSQERRRGGYARIASGNAADGLRTLRLSPIGMASRFNRENWASISLVNLLNNYPTRDVEACRGANDDGAEDSGTSDVT